MKLNNNSIFTIEIIFLISFMMISNSSHYVHASEPEQIMNSDEINSIKNCEIGIYGGDFSNGKYFLNVTLSTKENCMITGFSKINDTRESFDCTLPFDYLSTFNGWNDNAMWPEFPRLIPFGENCQSFETDESELSNYTFSKMTDKELIDKFQEILNVKTREDFFTIFSPEIEIEQINFEYTGIMLHIENMLKNRGWELLPIAAIHEDGSVIPLLDISEPKEFHGKMFRSVNIELFSIPIDELVEQHHSLVDKFDKLGINSKELVVTPELIDEINSDLKKFESIVVVLQYRGYDGTSEVEFINDEIIGTVTYFEKYSDEVLFKKQIPLGAVNIFGTMGLLKELSDTGTPSSYDDQVTMLNAGFVGTIASFNDPSDPENEISSGMFLASMMAFSPSVNNTITFQKSASSGEMTYETYEEIQILSPHDEKAEIFVSLSDEELLKEFQNTNRQFENIAEMFDESVILDWLVQEIPKLENKINSPETNLEIKNQLLEKTKFALDEIKKSKKLIREADLQGTENTLVKVQNILESMKDILNEKTSILGKQDVKSLQEEIDRLIDGNKKRGIEAVTLVLGEKSSFDFFNIYEEESSERMERLGIMATEIENRGYKFGVFVYFEPPEGLIVGSVIFTPELDELEEELDTATIPKWFKKASEFWTDGRISDTEFYNALQFLVTDQRIKIPDSYKIVIEESEETEEGLDFKVFTSLWLHDSFSDNVYVLGIQDLLLNNEIEMSEKYQPGSLDLLDYPMSLRFYN